MDDTAKYRQFTQADQTSPPNDKDRLELVLKQVYAELENVRERLRQAEQNYKNVQIMLDREKQISAAYRRVINDLAEDL